MSKRQAICLATAVLCLLPILVSAQKQGKADFSVNY